MKLKVSIVALLASIALIACSDEDASSTTLSTDEADATMVEETTFTDETVSMVPPVCVEYFDAVERFASQYPDLGASYKETMKETKEQIENAPDADKAAFELKCQAALDSLESHKANLPQ